MESETDLYIGLLVKHLGNGRPKFIIGKDMHNKIFRLRSVLGHDGTNGKATRSDSRFYGALFINNCHCMYVYDYIWTIYTLVVDGKK